MRSNILITGASSGLGAEMARQFAAAGHNLALTARREDRLKALQDEIAATHSDVTVAVHVLDVDDHDQVFRVFKQAETELGRLDRVIVNAGIGKGAPLGTGRFDANRDTAQTNFVSALAQTEAALEIFRRQNAGHLVLISSVSALRGMPKAATTYAATKAAVVSLAEGLRMELHDSPIKVTTILPGYIRSEMNEKVPKVPFIVDTETGVRAMVRAIQREPAQALVPSWPWRPFGFLVRRLPLPVLRRIL